MSKPYIHAQSSARLYGGKPEDYIAIHNLMDSSKGTIADNRHRALTHNSWFIAPNGPLELIFGVTITNSDGRKVSTRDIGEQHVLEDFGNKFIPTPQDYLEKMPMENWMLNGKGDVPPSSKTLEEQKSDITKMTQEQQTNIMDGLAKLIKRNPRENYLDGNRNRRPPSIVD